MIKIYYNYRYSTTITRCRQLDWTYSNVTKQGHPSEALTAVTVHGYSGSARGCTTAPAAARASFKRAVSLLQSRPPFLG
jgi:hypothetical protein